MDLSDNPLHKVNNTLFLVHDFSSATILMRGIFSRISIIASVL